MRILVDIGRRSVAPVVTGGERVGLLLRAPLFSPLPSEAAVLRSCPP